jgi:coatomer subunit beta
VVGLALISFRWAIASIYQNLESLIPDGPDLLLGFLEEESDATCKRNAFAALASISHDKALEYLSGVFDSVPNHEELLQLAELVTNGIKLWKKWD